MHQRIAQTLRYLAQPISQDTARNNAADGSAALRKRRRDQEDVNEYLRGRILIFPLGQAERKES